MILILLTYIDNIIKSIEFLLIYYENDRINIIKD